MTSTSSAAATGLPSAFPMLAASMPRRSFLAGLTKLSLVGGSVALLGQPSAVGEPVTLQMLEAYKTWLHYEYRHLAWEMAALPAVADRYGGLHGDRFRALKSGVTHFGTGDASSFHGPRCQSAVDRAALVLSTVGCVWHDDEAPADWLVPLRRA